MRELSLHILDLIQNSIVAGASLIELTIEENRKDDWLTIIIKDNGCGMNQDLVQRIRDPFFTTRTTRKVGLGIPLMIAACERCGGSLDIESEKGAGTKITARLRYGHIDRAPLGNMIDTVTSIILGKDDTDYVYRHIINNNDFVLDTRELRKVLGQEIPLSNPDIISWIRDYLTEGLNSISEV